MDTTLTACSLCNPAQEIVIWHNTRCRVVDAGDAEYPGYCRVIWNEHVREMSDLSDDQRDHLMRIVYGVEAALRAALQPTKLNLASLGNQVPHLHWHVVARFEDDPHFPDAIWAARRRNGAARTIDREALRSEIHRRLRSFV